MSDRETLIEARKRISAILRASPEWRYRMQEPIALYLGRWIYPDDIERNLHQFEIITLSEEVVRLNFEAGI
jgi:hypothetical protein